MVSRWVTPGELSTWRQDEYQVTPLRASTLDEMATVLGARFSEALLAALGVVQNLPGFSTEDLGP
jgi:hypothetical protein